MSNNNETPQTSVGIWVLGGSLGESIVIKTPGGSFGVIDCYSRGVSREEDAENPTIQLLQAQGVQRLHFIGFTHPHQDHYRGLPGIFRRYAGRIADLVLKRVEEYRAACVAKTEAHEAWLLVSHTRESDREDYMRAVDIYCAADNALDAAKEALHAAAESTQY